MIFYRIDKKIAIYFFSKYSAKNITELEELPFNMYVDTEVAQLIRALDKKKQKAISGKC